MILAPERYIDQSGADFYFTDNELMESKPEKMTVEGKVKK